MKKCCFSPPKEIKEAGTTTIQNKEYNEEFAKECRKGSHRKEGAPKTVETQGFWFICLTAHYAQLGLFKLLAITSKG